MLAERTGFGAGGAGDEGATGGTSDREGTELACGSCQRGERPSLASEAEDTPRLAVASCQPWCHGGERPILDAASAGRTGRAGATDGAGGAGGAVKADGAVLPCEGVSSALRALTLSPESVTSVIQYGGRSSHAMTVPLSPLGSVT